MERGIKVVLMGVDNSGKTTLSKNLIEALGLEGYDFKYVPPLGKAPLEKQLNRLDKILFNGDNLIIDRLPLIEEEVVGRVIRNRSNFDKVNKAKIFEYYKNIDVIIWCNPPLGVVTNWGDRFQMEGIKDNVEQLYYGYEELFFNLMYEAFDMPIVFNSYNWKEDITGRRFCNILESIVESIKEKKGEN